jgi:hypothetical protein
VSLGNYTQITNDLLQEFKPVMEDDNDAKQFIGLLEQVRNLANKDVQKRQMILSDLIFWKNQFENLQKQTEITLKKLEAVAYSKAVNELTAGKSYKPTETQIKNYLESVGDTPERTRHLERLTVVQKWAGILQDLYFVSQTTHKILGGGSVIG